MDNTNGQFSPSLEESYMLIGKFLEDNNIWSMHLQMYLSEKCGIVCRSEEDDEEIEEHLNNLKS